MAAETKQINKEINSEISKKKKSKIFFWKKKNNKKWTRKESKIEGNMLETLSNMQKNLWIKNKYSDGYEIERII